MRLHSKALISVIARENEIRFRESVVVAKGMENRANDDRSNGHYIKRRVSRTRLVMGLLLIIAIPIFIFLANKAVHENAEAIWQSFGR